MYIRRKIAFGALLAFTGGMAYAADQQILGNSLTVKDPKPGVDATKRKITGKGKEKNSPNTLVGNPVVSGGSLTVRANGGTPTVQTFPLPQGTSGITGKPFWSGDAVKGFKYKDSKGENGAVKSAQIKRSPSASFSIKAVVSGKLDTILVLPPNPGTSGCVLLGLTGGDTYSVAFQAGDGLITNKGNTLYKHKKVTLQNTCIIVTTTTTTTLVTTTTTSSTTTTTLYGSPSRAFVDRVFDLLD